MTKSANNLISFGHSSKLASIYENYFELLSTVTGNTQRISIRTYSAMGTLLFEHVLFERTYSTFLLMQS